MVIIPAICLKRRQKYLKSFHFQGTIPVCTIHSVHTPEQTERAQVPPALMGSWLMGRLLSRHLLPGAHQCHSPTCSLALQKYAGIWIGTQRGQLPISSTVKATEGVCHEISTEGNLGCKITPHSRNFGLKVLLLSRYYLRPRGRLTKLGEKNMSLRMDRKKCRIYGPQGKPTQQLC